MTSDPAPLPARVRMVRSAATLVREHGVHGSGLREIVTHSGGPRGSLQRYFPGGKTQLVSEALDVAAADLSAEVETALGQAVDLAAAIDAIVAPWRRLLVEHNFALGCPLAATVVDAADNDKLRSHVSGLLAQWHTSVANVFVKFGDPEPAAHDKATVLIAAIEGAVILARAQHSTRPLDTVQRYFATSSPQPTNDNR